MVMVLISCSVKNNTMDYSRINEISGNLVSNNQSLTAEDLKKSDESIKERNSDLVSEAYLRRFEVEKKALNPEENKSVFSELVKKKTVELLSGENVSGKSSYLFKDISKLKRFSVIAGSFADSVNSVKHIDLLRGLDYEPFYYKNTNGMFRVVAGTFDEKVDADIMVFRLENDSIKSWIMTK